MRITRDMQPLNEFKIEGIYILVGRESLQCSPCNYGCKSNLQAVLGPELMVSIDDAYNGCHEMMEAQITSSQSPP